MSTENGNEKIHMEPGIYEGVSFDDYVKIDAINHSELKLFKEASPAHYKYKKDKEIVDETKAKLDGRIYHEAVLEEGLFYGKYVHEPNNWKDYADILPAKSIEKLEENHNLMFDKRTKEYKLIKTAFDGKYRDSDKTIIDYSTYWKSEKIKDAVWSNDACRKILKNAKLELTIVWIDKLTELPCKGRIDIDSEMKGYFGDLKKTRGAKPFQFAKDCRKFGYYSQMAFYLDGLETLGHKEIKAVIILAVEDYEPFYVQPFYIPRESSWIQKGREWYLGAIEEFHFCKETDNWHGYYDRKNDNFNMYELPELMIS